MVQDFKDLTIRWNGHPRYNSEKIIEDDVIEVVLQKLEMLLFTNTNEIFGDDECAGDVEYNLWQTSLSNSNLKSELQEKITTYIPELDVIGYTLDLEIYDGDVRDIMYLTFVIKGYNIEFIFQ